MSDDVCLAGALTDPGQFKNNKICEQKRSMRNRNSGALRNLIALSIVLSVLKIVSPEVSLQNMSLLPTVSAMELNSKYQNSKSINTNALHHFRNHPVVR